MISEFSKAVEVSFQKAKALLWPMKSGLWLKLFILYLSTGGFGMPVANVPRFPSQQDKQDVSVSTTSASSVQAPLQFFENLKPKAQTLWATVRPYIYAAATALVILLALLIFLTIWFYARLQLVLFKCLYENEVEIGKYWKETRDAGQSYFIFTLWMLLIFILMFLLIAGGVVFVYLFKSHSMKALAIGSGMVIAFIVILMMLIGTLITIAMRLIPILMVRLGDSPWAAFKRVGNWVRENTKKAFVLFFLYGVLMIGLSIAMAIAVVLASLVVITPVVLAGVLVMMVVKSLWVKIILGILGAVLLSILVLAAWVASMVPAGTFFTYLKMELIEDELSRMPQLPAHAEG